ncbi:LacI family DNA-binding transcriptional regulator [Candidatus Leptofilum sp.]|uniref:LacI family DNA-binding transcriptional regulator n=1 Tax=Candidatus Leptofilum sp. TaxID=3241576 RepID=UPI003B5ADB8A
MTQKPATSIDVAQLAGVSQPTVSRAFDPNASIAADTRSRVLAAAKKLGYQPNVIARSLSTRRTNIVGLVMANVANSLFYPTVLEKMTDRLQKMGKQVLLFNVPLEKPVDDFLPRVLGYQVDGLIITSTTPSNEIADECARNGTPVILLNRFVEGSSANSVCCDNEQGGRLAADALLDADHAQIAYIGGPPTTFTNMMREAGFVGRLKERGYEKILLETGTFTYESGQACARRLLTLATPPDAIFCAADIMAMGVMDVARYEFDLQIPDQLSIIGFDDIPIAGWPIYNLTTIRQPVDGMIDAALELLDNHEDGIPTAEYKLLLGELIIRGSTKT